MEKISLYPGLGMKREELLHRVEAAAARAGPNLCPPYSGD